MMGLLRVPVLIVFDEAKGIARPTWEAMYGALTTEMATKVRNPSPSTAAPGWPAPAVINAHRGDSRLGRPR